MLTEAGTCLEEWNDKEKECRKIRMFLGLDRCESNS